MHFEKLYRVRNFVHYNYSRYRNTITFVFKRDDTILHQTQKNNALIKNNNLNWLNLNHTDVSQANYCMCKRIAVVIWYKKIVSDTIWYLPKNIYQAFPFFWNWNHIPNFFFHVIVKFLLRNLLRKQLILHHHRHLQINTKLS